MAAASVSRTATPSRTRASGSDRVPGAGAGPGACPGATAAGSGRGAAAGAGAVGDMARAFGRVAAKGAGAVGDILARNLTATGRPAILPALPRLPGAPGPRTVNAPANAPVTTPPSARPSAPPDARLDLARRWLSGELGFGDYTLAPASSDASFRRYFRVTRDGESLILMDAPPEREDSRPFVELAARLAAAGVTVPRVLATDLARGLLLVTDLGSTHYLAALTGGESPQRLYGDALEALLRMQTAVPTRGLPAYDEGLLRRELGVFREWYLGRHLGVTLTPDQARGLAAAEDALVGGALEQPRAFVHRDYHSRNLMLLAEGNPGVLDFQGALVGPVTYDLVSLLRDCYVAWDTDFVRETALGYGRRLEAAGVIPRTDPEVFLRWLDLTGAQRHLKAAGIFARLHHRDGKPHYLADIPRTLGYVREVAGRRAELGGLGELLEQVGA